VPRTPSAAAARIGARIAAERKSKGLTQDQLAVLSGIDSSNIRSYESGRSMLSILTLVRISEALHASPGSFIDEVSSADFATPLADGRRRAS
jgi:transcriptional regulator with XRE-family HTH domain